MAIKANRKLKNKSNIFELYDMPGNALAHKDIKITVDKAIRLIKPILRKYGELGAADTHTIGCIADYIFEKL